MSGRGIHGGGGGRERERSRSRDRGRDRSRGRDAEYGGRDTTDKYRRSRSRSRDRPSRDHAPATSAKRRDDMGRDIVDFGRKGGSLSSVSYSSTSSIKAHDAYVSSSSSVAHLLSAPSSSTNSISIGNSNNSSVYTKHNKGANKSAVDIMRQERIAMIQRLKGDADDDSSTRNGTGADGIGGNGDDVEINDDMDDEEQMRRLLGFSGFETVNLTPTLTLTRNTQ